MHKNDNILLENDLNEIDRRSNPKTIKYKLYSIYVNLLLSQEYFKQNQDIKNLTEKLNFKLKDYVFKSRTLIVARFMRRIEKLDDNEIIIFLDVAKGITAVNKIKHTKNRSKKDKNISAIDKFGRA